MRSKPSLRPYYWALGLGVVGFLVFSKGGAPNGLHTIAAMFAGILVGAFLGKYFEYLAKKKDSKT